MSQSRKRPFVLAVYNKSAKELPEGGRNPWEAFLFELRVGELEAEARARSFRSDGYPVDLLHVRMSGFP